MNWHINSTSLLLSLTRHIGRICSDYKWVCVNQLWHQTHLLIVLVMSWQLSTQCNARLCHILHLFHPSNHLLKLLQVHTRHCPIFVTFWSQSRVTTGLWLLFVMLGSRMLTVCTETWLNKLNNMSQTMSSCTASCDTIPVQLCPAIFLCVPQ